MIFCKCRNHWRIVLSSSVKEIHFPGGFAGKESACNAGDARDMGSIPGSRRSPGEVNGNPL